ncbi:hypothetical protein Pan54_12350 [Rubinisphaera italica]|uniref:Uncharacterized protein n=1 Tax=Rubinisphaera italica TaxID=2527969 RepID=A0A5C5XDQ4_9PLAN|nr:hypothetical protein Pan54_12350 [Rubinisphaera italica]
MLSGDKNAQIEPCKNFSLLSIKQDSNVRLFPETKSIQKFSILDNRQLIPVKEIARFLM